MRKKEIGKFKKENWKLEKEYGTWKSDKLRKL